MPQEQVAFFDRVFAKDGDIFEGAVFDWEAVKEVILMGIFEGVQELESFSVLDVPDEVIARVAKVISTAEKFGVRGRLVGPRDRRHLLEAGTSCLGG